MSDSHDRITRLTCLLGLGLALGLASPGCFAVPAPAPRSRTNTNDASFRKAVETDRFPSAKQAGL